MHVEGVLTHISKNTHIGHLAFKTILPYSMMALRVELRVYFIHENKIKRQKYIWDFYIEFQLINSLSTLLEMLSRDTVCCFHVHSQACSWLGYLVTFCTGIGQAFKMICFYMILYICNVWGSLSTLDTLPQLSLIFICDLLHECINIWKSWNINIEKYLLLQFTIKL